LRQPGESLRCYRAFVLYRDLPPAERTQERVAEHLRMARGMVSDWALRHFWTERIEEWEARLCELEQARSIEQRLLSNQQQVEVGDAMAQAVLAAMRRGEPLPLEQVPRFAEAAYKLKRQGLGERDDASPPSGSQVSLGVALSFGSEAPGWSVQHVPPGATESKPGYVQPSTIGPASPVPIGSPQIERPSEEEAKDE
jgi:hypothetical protein